MADKKISQLTAASQVNSDAVFPLSQIVSGSDATVKATVGQVGNYIADEQTFAGLNTSAKDLIGAINEIAAGGGGGGSANLVSFQSANRGGGATLSYTFAANGVYQFVAMLTGSAAPAPSEITITLNNNVITPSVRFIAESWQYPYAFFVDEISVNAGDVLKIQVTSMSNRGTQLTVFSGGSLERFNLINLVENGGYIFSLNPNCRYFQVYNCGYYQSNNNYQYGWTTGSDYSIPTPSGSDYWYGFTYAFTI